MKNFYSLVLLIFGAFAVTTTVASDVWVHPQFESYQRIINTISTSTLGKIKDLEAKIELSSEKEIKDLKYEEQSQKTVFSQDCEEVMEEAKENGKNAEKIQSCVNAAEKMYSTKVMKNNKKILKCINKATEIAKEKVKQATKTFQSNSFESPLSEVQNDLRGCYKPYNQNCIDEKIAEYQKNMAVTNKAATEAIQSSVLAFDEHDAAMQSCIGNLRKKFVDLQKNSYETLTKCISA